MTDYGFEDDESRARRMHARHTRAALIEAGLAESLTPAQAIRELARQRDELREVNRVQASLFKDRVKDLESELASVAARRAELPEGWSWLSDDSGVAVGPDGRRVWVYAGKDGPASEAKKAWSGSLPHVEYAFGRDAEPVAVVEAVLARWHAQQAGVERIDALLGRAREAVGDPHASTSVVISLDGGPVSWVVGGQITFTTGGPTFGDPLTPPPKTYGRGATEREALHDALDHAARKPPDEATRRHERDEYDAARKSAPTSDGEP